MIQYFAVFKTQTDGQFRTTILQLSTKIMIQIPNPKSHPNQESWSGRTTKTAPWAASSRQMAQELSPCRPCMERQYMAISNSPTPTLASKIKHMSSSIQCSFSLLKNNHRCHLIYVAFPTPFWLNLPNWKVICAAHAPHTFQWKVTTKFVM